jgi:ribosomal protein RSM22 (predicted rRNA methylase)
MSLSVIPALPPRLRAVLDALLGGHKETGSRAEAISAAYRRGEGSVLEIRAERDALAYATVRMPATFAAAAAAFARLAEVHPSFTPATLLDVGTGPGTLLFAAREQWPSLTALEAIESNGAFCDFARRLLGAVDDSALAATVLRRETLQTLTTDPTSARHDLVAAGYVLVELPLAEVASAATRLFAQSSHMLVLIEPGTPAGFARIRAARAALVQQGAQVLAPCPHDHACPLSGDDWCHFNQRLPRSRAHMQAKRVQVPFEDERFSYVAVSRAPIQRQDAVRIIAPVHSAKAGVTLKLCTTTGLTVRTIDPRTLKTMSGWRRWDWGDRLVDLHE